MQSIEARCQVEHKDLVGAALAGNHLPHQNKHDIQVHKILKIHMILPSAIYLFIKKILQI